MTVSGLFEHCISSPFLWKVHFFPSLGLLNDPYAEASVSGYIIWLVLYYPWPMDQGPPSEADNQPTSQIPCLL
jgi:hypothetical protein